MRKCSGMSEQRTLGNIKKQTVQSVSLKLSYCGRLQSCFFFLKLLFFFIVPLKEAQLNIVAMLNSYHLGCVYFAGHFPSLFPGHFH